MYFIKKIKPGIILTSCLISMAMLAQPGAPIENTDELAKQKTVITEDYPGIFKEEEINKIEKIDPKHSKIYYTRDHVNFEAIVNSDRKELLLIATCEEIPVDKLPKIVRDNFMRGKDGNSKIEKAFIATTPYSSDFYRIDFYKKGENGSALKSLFYTDKGEYMVPPY